MMKIGLHNTAVQALVHGLVLIITSVSLIEIILASLHRNFFAVS